MLATIQITDFFRISGVLPQWAEYFRTQLIDNRKLQSDINNGQRPEGVEIRALSVLPANEGERDRSDE
jgi:hypothetical protein